MVHVDGGLKDGTVAILAGGIVAEQVGAAELLPRLPRLPETQVADQPVQLTDTEHVGRARRLWL